MQKGRINLREARKISKEHFQEWTRKANPLGNDVVLSRRCNPGETAFVEPGMEFALGQNLVLLRSDGVSVLPQFLRWITRGPEWWNQINTNLNVGAVFTSLKCADIPNFKLSIPSLPEQRAIASILGSLDDKIELNRRTCETLEEMARAIFKSWFVDFDPVRAKMAGEKPASICKRLGLTQEMLDLFPNKLVDSEMGEIPERWEVKPFSETVEIIGGGTPKTSIHEYWDGDIPWFSVVDAPSLADIWVVDTEKRLTKKGVDCSSASILPVGTTIISARGTVGKLALVGVPMAMNQSCYGLHGKQGAKGYFNYFSTRALVSDLQQRSHGSVFDTITRDTFAGVTVAVPSEQIIDCFEQCVEPILRYSYNNILHSRTLTFTRDSLLPKLISGEIEVPLSGGEA
jgi:Restriction endonuclease S subunits